MEVKPHHQAFHRRGLHASHREADGGARRYQSQLWVWQASVSAVTARLHGHAVEHARLCKRRSSHRTDLSYRAPSWSWVSLDGRVQMADFDSTTAAFQPIVTQVKAEMAPLAQDPHGKLITGRLTL